MANQYSIAEAKDKLPAIVHAVETGLAVKLTRHGKPVAILLSMREYEQMQWKSLNFWDDLMAVRQQLTHDDITITGEEFLDLRDTSPGRSTVE